MNELEANAMLGALQAQRDQALNTNVMLHAQIALLKLQVQQLEAKVPKDADPVAVVPPV